MKQSVELAYKYEAVLGEGPIWDEKRQELIWLDVLEGKVMYFSPSAGTNTEYLLGKQVGALALTQNLDLVLALRDGFGNFSPVTGEITSFTQVVTDPEVRFNDGAVDAQGRFLAGTMRYAPQPDTGALYSFSSDGNWKVLIPHVGVSNGICWSQDSTRMYYIDSLQRNIQVFNYDITSGKVSNPEVFIEIPHELGIPDGMTIDQEENLWVAMWDGWKILKISKTGVIIEQIPLPVSRVTSLTFGGADLRDLYITTARFELTDKEISNQPLAGSLFVMRNEIPGLVENRMK